VAVRPVARIDDAEVTLLGRDEVCHRLVDRLEARGLLRRRLPEIPKANGYPVVLRIESRLEARSTDMSLFC
jgi:hypothetical protein